MRNKILAVIILLICVLQINVFALPENIINAKNLIQTHKFEVSMSAANTADSVIGYLNSEISGLLSEDIELYDVALTDFRAATPVGVDGYGGFSFTAELRYDGYRITTDIINGVINTSRVVVTAVSGSETVETGEELILSAEAFEISGVKYEWYRAESKDAPGVLIDEAVEKTYYPDTGTPHSAYYYCVCNGVRSNYLNVKVIPRFQPVEKIELINSAVYMGIAANLNFIVYPDNATYRDLTWSVYDMDGQARVENGKLVPVKPGNVTVMAVVKNGLGEGIDFAESFTLTVLPEKTVVPVGYELDISDISGISSAVTASNEAGIYPLSKTDIRRIISKSRLSAGKLYTLCGFSFGETAIDCTVTLESYTGYVTVITEADGKHSYQTVETKDGKIDLKNAKSVVLMAEKKFEQAWLLAPMLVVPFLGLAVTVVFIKRKK